MYQRLQNKKFLPFAFLIAMTLLTTGCASINPGTTQEVPVSAAAVANGKYTVEMHTTFGKVNSYNGELTGKSTVSEALAQSGAIKKYRSMEVEILRIVEHEGRNRGLKMPVRYNLPTRSVASEQDYALVDGDRVVVKPSPNGSFAKMLDSLTSGG